MSDERPVVSVVIPVYNGAAHLVQLIESLQAQTLESFEAISSTIFQRTILLRLYKNMLRTTSVSSFSEWMQKVAMRALALCMGLSSAGESSSFTCRKMTGFQMIA